MKKLNYFVFIACLMSLTLCLAGSEGENTSNSEAEDTSEDCLREKLTSDAEQDELYNEKVAHKANHCLTSILAEREKYFSSCAYSDVTINIGNSMSQTMRVPTYLHDEYIEQSENAKKSLYDINTEKKLDLLSSQIYKGVLDRRERKFQEKYKVNDQALATMRKISPAILVLSERGVAETKFVEVFKEKIARPELFTKDKIVELCVKPGDTVLSEKILDKLKSLTLISGKITNVSDNLESERETVEAVSESGHELRLHIEKMPEW